jgi:hydroxymethylpyrimidine pyrophosphatase-like HAD family hydrolase
MRLRVLALDVDGTIDVEARFDEDLAAALREVRGAGLLTVLVSARMLADIEALIPAPDLFDAIVAESGCVVQMANGAPPTVLARGPDAALVAELDRRNVAHRSGLCTVEADAAAAPEVLAGLLAVGSPHGITFDHDRLTILPQGVGKASGLSEVVWRLGASLHNAIAIGAGEDALPMLDLCEIGAAVAWGSNLLARSADQVVPGSGPTALAEYIRRLVATEVIVQRRKPDSPLRLRLGTYETGEPVDIQMRGRNVLCTGDPGSGKSWLIGLLCEQLILRRYAFCIVDPEGDYSCLEALPGVIVHRVQRDEEVLPRLEWILRQPTLSVVVDLSLLASEAKLAAARSLLREVDILRRAFGVPHRVVLDEAHYFLHDRNAAALLDPMLGECYLVTYRTSDLAPGVLDACDVIVATRIADRRRAARLLELARPEEPALEWVDTLADLSIGEAVLLRISAEEARGPARFTLQKRVTAHVRHRKKYIDVGVPPGREFVFTRDGRPTEHRARTLSELLAVLPTVPADVLASHLARGDFHRWIEDVVGDRDLGGWIRVIERGGGGHQRENILRAIRDRYVDIDPQRECSRDFGRIPSGAV